MIRTTLAAIMLTASVTTAHADYEISPMGEPGAYTGCLAIDSEAEMGFVAVGQSVAVLAYSKLLRLRVGDEVNGTWTVDDSTARKLDRKTSTADTVTADLPATRETLALLGNGKTFSVTIGATDVEWSLAGSAKALKDLGACMDKNVKS